MILLHSKLFWIFKWDFRSQSGTGKTATFSIGILQSLDIKEREVQALVLSPTRELAQQIQKVILALGDYMNVQCHACIGGTNLGEDMRILQGGQHVVSGTPGRVYGEILFYIVAQKSVFVRITNSYNLYKTKYCKKEKRDRLDAMLLLGF